MIRTNDIRILRKERFKNVPEQTHWIIYNVNDVKPISEKKWVRNILFFVL